ncbi:unnamed protein product [Ilex paraguariensis]|uniref:rRNA biogenesis protein RRP36 n=1 Tax=Ilex paraguariensis TaxID=185542 RepID=A0ABC8S8P9_9AQUA
MSVSQAIFALGCSRSSLSASPPSTFYTLPTYKIYVHEFSYAEFRKQKLIEKYTELNTSKKLESFIEKKRRKNAAKDHRFMPYRRPSNNE